jgi:excisionase family DNA binding protein
MIAPSRIPEPQPFRLAVDSAELADGLGVSVRTIAELVKQNQIPYCYVSKRCLRFNLKAVQAWLDSKTTPAAMAPQGDAP